MYFFNLFLVQCRSLPGLKITQTSRTHVLRVYYVENGSIIKSKPFRKVKKRYLLLEIKLLLQHKLFYGSCYILAYTPDSTCLMGIKLNEYLRTWIMKW